MNNNTKNGSSICFIGCPYKLNDNDTMNDWYQRYKADDAAKIEKDGKTYYRIISKWRVTSGDKQFVLCNVDSKVFVLGQKKYMDENGNTFECVTFVWVHFSGEIPDWYTEAPPYEFSGNIEAMGEYLTAADE